MKSRTFLLAVLLALPYTAAATEPPTRIGLQVPDSVLAPGQRSRLVVELLGEDGKPALAPQAFQIEIKGIGGLSQETRAAFPASSSRIEVPIQASKPGFWKIEASAPGLLSGFGVVACGARERAAETEKISVQDAPGGGFSHHATLRPVLPVPPPSPPTGQVLLIAQPDRLRRGREGWEPGRVDAYWVENGSPEASPSDLSVDLVMEQGGEAVTVSPSSLEIPAGAFKSRASATLSARDAGTARLRAFYLRGKSDPIQIQFLKPNPSRVGFVNEHQIFRGLTAVTTEVFVRLFDAAGKPVVTDLPVEVEVAVQGPTGSRSFPATIKPGATQTKVPIELNRPGRYTATASAPALDDSSPLEIRFALDWLLIVSSLLGGVLGSLTRVLYRKENVWPKGLARVLALGVTAALLVLLLSVFGVLSILGNVLPAAGALEKVPATNLFGALLLGFVAGMVFDKVLGRFLGGTKGRRKPRRKTPEAAPATSG